MIITLNVQTGEQTSREMTPEEISALPGPAPVLVPQSISRAQGKAMLITLGLWQNVLDYVAAIPDPTQRALADVALHDTQNWERDSPFLASAAASLGLTAEQMDTMFVQASEIRL